MTTTQTPDPATHVLEIKHKLNGQKLEFYCQSLVQNESEVVVLYRTEQDFQIADQLFKTGSLSLGYFWEDRNYNIYHWLDADMQSIAVYVNIADRTEIEPGRVEWRDLIIDLLITPDGRCQILDEDELPDDLPADLQQLIDNQTQQLHQKHQTLLAEIEQYTRQLLSQHPVNI